MTLPAKGVEGQWEQTAGLWRQWTLCPDCRDGRWVLECNTRKLNYTGRCTRCHRGRVKHDLGIYFPGQVYGPDSRPPG